MKYPASTRLPMRRPCMSVKATTTVSTSPRSTWSASSSWVRIAFRVRGSVSMSSPPGFPMPVASLGNEALKQGAGPWQVGRQLLGVALDGNDQSVVRLHGLHGAIFAVRGLLQARGKLLDRLMMKTVNPYLVLAGGAAELRGGVDLDGVSQMAAPQRAHVVVLEMLHQRTAHGDVDHLLSPADTKHGDLVRPGLAKQAQLGLVQLGVDRTHLLVLLLPIQRGIDVPAARK